jgi:hypothetical protein
MGCICRRRWKRLYELCLPLAINWHSQAHGRSDQRIFLVYAGSPGHHAAGDRLSFQAALAGFPAGQPGHPVGATYGDGGRWVSDHPQSGVFPAWPSGVCASPAVRGGFGEEGGVLLYKISMDWAVMAFKAEA